MKINAPGIGGGLLFLTTAGLFTLITLASCRAGGLHEKEDLSAGNGFYGELMTVEELREDFTRLSEVIRQRHPMLFADKDRYAELLEETENRLNAPMNAGEFFRLLNPLATELNCGHTNLNVSAAQEEFLRKCAEYLPLETRIVGGRLIILRDLSAGSGKASALQIPPGTEILAINGKEIGDVLRILGENVSRDGENTTKRTATVNRWFSCLYYLFMETPDTFRLLCRIPGEARNRTVVMKAAPVNSLAMTPMSIYYPRSAHPWSMRIGDSAAVLTLNSFIISDRKSYRVFLEEFFTRLEEQNIRSLVIDLRGNWGGSPWYTARLLAYLIDRPVEYFHRDNPFYLFRLKKPVFPADNAYRGDLKILIDGACFSSTGHLLSLLKYYRTGEILGEESGGSYICTDASRDLVLKNSGIRLHYSTGAFRTAVEGIPAGRGILPDTPISFTAEDYLEGHDPVMAGAMAGF